MESTKSLLFAMALVASLCLQTYGCPSNFDVWEYPGQDPQCCMKTIAAAACTIDSCDPNAICTGSGAGARCRCVDGSTPMNGFCFFKANASVPHTVHPNTACAPSLVYHYNSCICPRGYTYDEKTVECVPPPAPVCEVGHDLWEYPDQLPRCHQKTSTNSECTSESCDPNAVCVSSGAQARCTCLHGASELEGFCFFDANSTVAGNVDPLTACAPELSYHHGYCICPLGWGYDKVTKKCLEPSGSEGCPGDHDLWEYPHQEPKCHMKTTTDATCTSTSCDPNAQCSGSGSSARCKCRSGASATNGFCFYGVNATVPSTVNSESACAPTLEYHHGYCVEGPAECPTDHEVWKYPDQHPRCHMKTTTNAACTSTSCDPNAQCSGSGSSARCKCQSGASDFEGFCFFSVNASVPASVDSDTACAPTLEYHYEYCVCAKGFKWDKSAEQCIVSDDEDSDVGDFCSDDADCEDANAECIMSNGFKRCQCMDGYNMISGHCSNAAASGGVIVEVNSGPSFFAYVTIAFFVIVLGAIVLSVILLKMSFEKAQRTWALAIVENVRLAMLSSSQGQNEKIGVKSDSFA